VNWQNGSPPPTVGWYRTTIPPDYKDTNAYRWWDGEVWSWAAFPHENAEVAGKWAEKKLDANISELVMWRET